MDGRSQNRNYTQRSSSQIMDGRSQNRNYTQRSSSVYEKHSEAPTWKTDKTTKQLSAQRRRQRKREAKRETEERMAFVGPGCAHAIKVLSDAPADTSDWDAVIEKALDGVRITEKDRDQREHILGLVEQTLKPHYPRAICKLFGSSDTRLGFKDCNIDVYLSIGYDPYFNTTEKEGREKASKLARRIGGNFKRHPELTMVGTHVGGRSPLVKLHHTASKTRVDLSLCNVFAVPNSSLVRLQCDAHPQVRSLLLLLRLWAVTQEIAGRGRPKFRLTNYVLTQLALFTCMARQQKLVPSLEDLRKLPYDSNMIEGWECGYSSDVTAFWKQQKKGPPANVEGGVLALALEFFEMYAGLDCFRWAVCPMVGSLLDRHIFRRAAVAAQSASGGPQSDCDTDGEEAAADDNKDTVMITDNCGDKAMISENGADTAMITDDDADKAMIIDNDADGAMVTNNGAVTAMITDDCADKAMIMDDGADKAMIIDDGADKALITVNDAGDRKVTETGIDNSMITDDGANDTMVTDKSVDGTVITEIARTAAAVTTSDAVATDFAVSIADADATDAAGTTTDAAAVTTTGAGATAAAVPTTDAVATAAAVTDAVATAAAVPTTGAVATAAAVPTTDAVATAAAVTDAVATVAAVTTTDAVSKDAAVTTTDIVATGAAVATASAVTTTDAVATAAAVATDNSTCAGNRNGATNVTNAKKTTTYTNYFSKTEAESAADSGNSSSLPEVLLPHLEKIGKRYRVTPLCVLDLFVLDTNFTHQYSLVNLRSFQEKCRKSAAIIEDVLKGEKSLSALFTKIEVSS